MTATLGADPEFFLYDNQYGSYGGIRPCVGIIPGTKESPHPLSEEGYAVHEDNVAIELTIPPCRNSGNFASSVLNGKQLIRDEFLNEEQYLNEQSAHRFTIGQLNTKQAKAFGCEPDYDAYTGGKMRSVGKDLTEGRFRFAGGHVHLGGDFNCPPFVAALLADLFITLPAYAHSNTPGTYALFGPYYRHRLGWYGRPGIFREKPYGIEYRTPGPYWTTNLDSAYWMGERSMRLIHYLENTSATEIRSSISEVNWLEVQTFLSDPHKDKKLRDNMVYFIQDNISRVLPI